MMETDELTTRIEANMTRASALHDYFGFVSLYDMRLAVVYGAPGDSYDEPYLLHVLYHIETELDRREEISKERGTNGYSSNKGT